MSGIVFIGSEGCGKTVLITVLSRLYRPTSDQGLQLDPANRKTAEYVERAWQALKRSEWPPSNPPGQITELEWQYRFANGANGVLRLIDSAGQDLRQIFADDTNWQDLPEPLVELGTRIQMVDAVAILVNLRDFRGEADEMKRLANEWLLRGAMHFRRRYRPSAPICLVFTQSDLYCDELNARGNLKAVAYHYLQHVAGMYLQDDSVPIFAVSAVDKTEIRTDEQGRPRRVPGGKLSCKGFSGLVEWMAKTISNQPVTRQTPTMGSERAPSHEEAPPPNSPAPLPASEESDKFQEWLGFAMIAGFLLLLMMCCGMCSSSGTPQ